MTFPVIKSDPASDLEDVVRMKRITANDSDALRELYELHGRLAYSIAYRVCRHSADAQEVVAAVFCELWKNSDRFHPQRGSFRTYLMLLTRSRALDLVRSSQKRWVARQEAMSDLQAIAACNQSEANPSQQLEDLDEKDHIRRKLDSLPKEFAHVLRLAFFEGMTHQEIAEEMGQPLGTIKSRIRRGLEKFRDQWTDFEGGIKES